MAPYNIQKTFVVNLFSFVLSSHGAQDSACKVLCLLKALKCIRTSTLFFILVSQNGPSGETYDRSISHVRSHLFSFSSSKGHFSGIDLSSGSVFLGRVGFTRKFGERM